MFHFEALSFEIPRWPEHTIPNLSPPPAARAIHSFYISLNATIRKRDNSYLGGRGSKRGETR